MGSIQWEYFYGYQNPGHLMEVEQSVLDVELEPTDRVCVVFVVDQLSLLYTFWAINE